MPDRIEINKSEKFDEKLSVLKTCLSKNGEVNVSISLQNSQLSFVPALFYHLC